MTACKDDIRATSRLWSGAMCLVSGENTRICALLGCHGQFNRNSEW